MLRYFVTPSLYGAAQPCGRPLYLIQTKAALPLEEGRRTRQLTPVLKYRAWKVTLQFLPRSLRGAQSGFAFSPVMGSQLPRRRKNLPFLVFLALVRLRRRTSPDG